MAKRKKNVNNRRKANKGLPKSKSAQANRKATERKKLQEELYRLLLAQEEKSKRKVSKGKQKGKIGKQVLQKKKLAEQIYKQLLEEEKKPFKPVSKHRPKKETKKVSEFFEPKPGERVREYEERTGVQVSDIPEERLRYKGKFISEEFEKIIRAAAGASKKSPQDLLSDPANTKALDNVLNKNKAEAYKTANTIIDKISGRQVIEVTDGSETWYLTDKEAIQRIVTFDTRVKRMENGVVYVGILITEYLDGRTVIYLPRKRATAEEMEEFLNDYTEYLIYES